MKRALAAGLLVFGSALGLRLALLPSARFGGDEALFYAIGLDIVAEGARPLLGPQVTDGEALLPGPAFFYLTAAPLLFFRGPEAQYVFVELLGALTVWIFWHALRRPFGERGALYFGLLMAFSPWSALYADRTWNPNVLPLFIALAFFCAVRLREKPDSRLVVPFLGLCALMPQFHLSAPVIWAGLAVLVAPTVKHWKPARLLDVLLLTSLIYAPMLRHELTSDFSNTGHLFAETLGSQGGSEGGAGQTFGFLWVPVYAFRFLTLDVSYHELSAYWGGPDELASLRTTFFGSPARPFHVFRLLALLASMALALWALFAVFSRKQRRFAPWAWSFFFALLTNTLLLAATGKPIFGHYVTNLYPFAFVAFAVFGNLVLDPVERPRSVALALALAAIFCLGGIEATLSVSRKVDGRTGLRAHRRALEKIRADGLAEGNSSEPVHLDFDFRSSEYDWEIFARRAMSLDLRFDPHAKRRYRLAEKGPPLAGLEPYDLGFAWLYRVREPF